MTTLSFSSIITVDQYVNQEELMSIMPTTSHQPLAHMPTVVRKGVFIDSHGEKKKVYNLTDVLSKSERLQKRIEDSEIELGDLTVKQLRKDLSKSISIALSDSNPFVRASCLNAIVISSPFRLSDARIGTQERNREKDESTFYKNIKAIKQALSKLHLYPKSTRFDKERRSATRYMSEVDKAHSRAFYETQKGRLLVSLNDSIEDTMKALQANNEYTIENSIARAKDKESIHTLLIREKVLDQHPSIFDKAKAEFRNLRLKEYREKAAEKSLTEEQIHESVSVLARNSKEDIIKIANQMADQIAKEQGISIEPSDIGKEYTFSGEEDSIKLVLAHNFEGNIVAIFHHDVDVNKLPEYAAKIAQMRAEKG